MAKMTKKLIKKSDLPKIQTPKYGSLEVYQTAATAGDKGTWRWRLRSRNGKILANAGEAYVRRTEALKSAERMVAFDLSKVTVVELKEVQPAQPGQPAPQPAPAPFQTPGAPSGLVATPGTDKITLTWNAPTTGGPVLMYHVDRRDASGPFITIVKHEDKLTATTYVDTKVKAGILYTYRVLAHGVNMQHSPYSNEANAVVPVNIPDTTPPLVMIMAPGDGSSVGGTIEVKVRAEDQNGIKQVELRTDGTSRGFSSTPVGDRYRFLLDTKIYANGQHTLTAVATDNAGNSATSAAVGIHVQNL